MKRWFALVLIAAMLVPGALAEPQPLRVGALKGPTAMGMVKLMQDAQGGGEYAFTLAASPDALLPALARGEMDLACLPANLAAILYANTQGAVRVVNINTLGVLYIVERGGTVKSLADLSGRTLYASGKASTPEYALNHLLALAGVSDLNIEWKAEHSEALAAMLTNPEALAMLPQPFVAVAQGKNPDIRVALDLNHEWEALGQGSMVTGVTVARRELIEQQPECLNRFLQEYQASTEYVTGHPAQAAALIEGFGILGAQAAERALPECGITAVTGQEMKELLQPFYQVLFAQNPASTGGSLPDDAFYYLP